MYFSDRGCVRTLRTLYVYATGLLLFLLSLLPLFKLYPGCIIWPLFVGHFYSQNTTKCQLVTAHNYCDDIWKLYLCFICIQLITDLLTAFIKMCCVVVTMVMPYQPQRGTNIAAMASVQCIILLSCIESVSYIIFLTDTLCYLPG